MKRDGVLKYLVGGLCAAIFLAAAVRLIQREGERTRRELRNATAEVQTKNPNRMAGGAHRLPDKVAETIVNPSGDALGDIKPVERGQPKKLSGKVISGEGLPSAKTATAEGPTPPEGAEAPASESKSSPPAAPMPPAPPATAPPGPTTSTKSEGVPKTPPPATTANVQPPAPNIPPVPRVPAPAAEPVRPGADLPALRPPPERPVLVGDVQMPPGPGVAASQEPRSASRDGGPTTIYHHASTAEEGYLRGMADVARVHAQANLDNSAAAVNYSVARQNEIQNRSRWTQTYFEMRRMNRAYRAEERGPPPSMQDLVRYAQVGKPERLRPSQLDCVSGRIQWPLLLQREEFAQGRAELEAVFAARAQQGGIGVDDYLKIRQTTDQMKAELKAELRQVPPSQYEIAKRFLESLAYEADLPAS